MKLAPPKNANYAATVVELKQFAPLAGCDNVQAALIYGNQVIVGKDAKPGDIGLFFPVETALSHEFLAANNLYVKPEYGNVDPAKKGFFEKHGRVKCVKFRGHRSEGFYIPFSAINYICENETFEIGQEFDEINGHEICRKYVPARNPGRIYSAPKARGRAEDRIQAGQFAYHIDTTKLDRNIHKLNPQDLISVTDKWHGTSAIFAHVLVNRPLNFLERCLATLGMRIEKTCYDYVWASRRVIKGVGDKPREGVQHYYASDIWGTVFQEVKDAIPKGYTLYGEIVGWTPDGSPIQDKYAYGCAPGQHKFLVYRATYTNPDGKVLNLSWPQIREFCNSRGLEHVRHLFYGYAGDLFGQTVNPVDENWQTKFLELLKQYFVNDSMCPFNNREVPAEGVVLRIERSDEFMAFKKKATRFLEFETKQLDKGVADIETVESEEING